MAHPSKNADPSDIEAKSRTFFVSSRTSQGRCILQTERMATLLIDVLKTYAAAGRFRLHEFVIMRDHIHLLLTVEQEMTIEKAVQLIKGNFSYRAKKELQYLADIWQRGFSEVRIYDRESFLARKSYIHNNPVKAGYAATPGEYPYSSAYLRAAAAKAGSISPKGGPAEAVP